MSCYATSVILLTFRAVEALVRAPAVMRRTVAGVWLFGSFARGEETPSSDIDLAILCDPALGVDRATVMDQVGLALGRDVDVIDLRTAPPSLAWEILTRGRVVDERDELEVERFVRAARFEAEDDEQRSRMALLGQMSRVREVGR